MEKNNKFIRKIMYFQCQNGRLKPVQTSYLNLRSKRFIFRNDNVCTVVPIFSKGIIIVTSFVSVQFKLLGLPKFVMV